MAVLFFNAPLALASALHLGFMIKVQTIAKTGKKLRSVEMTMKATIQYGILSEHLSASSSFMRRITMHLAARAVQLVLRVVRKLRTDRRNAEHELIGFMGARS